MVLARSKMMAFGDLSRAAISRSIHAGCDATFGCLQHEYLVEIALAVESVCGPGESPFKAIQIVARREIVECDQRESSHRRTDTLVALEEDGHQKTFPRPRCRCSAPCWLALVGSRSRQ